MNQFAFASSSAASCTVDSLGPTGLHHGPSMFSPTATHSASSLDYYSRYPNCPTGNGAVYTSYGASGGGGQVGPSPAAQTPTSYASQAYLGAGDYPQAGYPSQASSMEYFRKYSSALPDFNNNNSIGTATADIKREVEPHSGTSQQAGATPQPQLSPIKGPENGGNDSPVTACETDDDDYEDDAEGDDDQLDASLTPRTPIYLSSNCLLYSYIGTDTLAAINDHFQRSFTLWFQSMRNNSAPSLEKGATTDSGWNSANSGGGENGGGGLSGGGGKTSKFWSPQSYYSQYKDVQLSSGGDTAPVCDSNIASGEKPQPPGGHQLSPSSPSVSASGQSSPVSRKGKQSLSRPSLSVASGSASPTSVRASSSGASPTSPKETSGQVGGSKGDDAQLDGDTSRHASLSAYPPNHQTLRSVAYSRRYERRKRRYLKRLQLMATPMIRRKLPISFWKFSAMFSCYYAGGGSCAPYPSGNGYGPMTPYMGVSSSGYQLSPTAGGGMHLRGAPCQQIQAGTGAYGGGGYGNGAYVEPSEQTVDSSGPVNYGAQSHGAHQNHPQHQQQHYEGGHHPSSALIKNESECHQVHHQSSMSAVAGHPVTPYRTPLSLSVSMTIGGQGGLGGSAPVACQTPTSTSSMTPALSATRAPTTTTSSIHASKTSAAAAATAALATLPNDLTLDMSIHISPAIALGAAAAAAAGSLPVGANGYSAQERSAVPPAPSLYHHQNASSYLGLLQSSLQSESYHHYYQYSSKFTASSSSATSNGASNGASCQAQGPNSSVECMRPPYGSPYGSTANCSLPENGGVVSNQSWARGHPYSHHPHHPTAAPPPAHYPSSFSQMMIAHRTSTTYPVTYTTAVDPPQSESLLPPPPTPPNEIAYPSEHLGYGSHSNYQHEGATAAPSTTASPFIAVAAAAVRSYQDAMAINGGHGGGHHQQHHHGASPSQSKHDSDTLASDSRSSLYLQH